MKIKIISIGIALSLITACGVSNSKKTKKNDPHRINGLWLNRGVFRNPDVHGQDIYLSYLYVNYPSLQGCTTLQTVANADVLLDTALTKENLKVAHTEKNYFKVKRINGDLVNRENAIYEIEADSIHNSDASLTIYETKNGTKLPASPLYSYQESSPSSQYQTCLNNAKDTTGVFIDIQ